MASGNEIVRKKIKLVANKSSEAAAFGLDLGECIGCGQGTHHDILVLKLRDPHDEEWSFCCQTECWHKDAFQEMSDMEKNWFLSRLAKHLFIGNDAVKMMYFMKATLQRIKEGEYPEPHDP